MLSKKSLLFVVPLLWLLLLAGCQSTTPMRYDGVYGYQVSSRTAGQIGLSYTAESQLDWNTVESLARASCAEAMNRSTQQVRLQVLDRQEITQKVNVASGKPVAAGFVGDIRDNARISEGVAESYNNSGQPVPVMRYLRMKRLLARCEVAN